MIEEYITSIKKLKERRRELSKMVLDHTGCKSDLLKRIVMIDDELNDLYDILGYLISPVPRSKIFLD